MKLRLNHQLNHTPRLPNLIVANRMARDQLRAASTATSTSSGDKAAIKIYDDYALADEKNLFQDLTEENVDDKNCFHRKSS